MMAVIVYLTALAAAVEDDAFWRRGGAFLSARLGLEVELLNGEESGVEEERIEGCHRCSMKRSIVT